MKVLILMFIFVSAPALAQHDRLSAREACADDYWKWCPSSESPYDCFKRRGFFRKDSILSLDCKKAWVKPKAKSDTPEKPVEQEVAPAPSKLSAQPKKQPASTPEPEKSKAAEEPDDFDNLDFQ